jgi:hypothetical protein
MFLDLGNSEKHGTVCAGCKCHLQNIRPQQIQGKWIEAAGTCTFQSDEYGSECGAKMMVMVKDGWGIFKCEKGHEDEDAIGWTYYSQPVVFQGQYYLPFSKRSNRAHCVNCGRIVYEIPLILWGPNAPEKVKWELNFCFHCVHTLGIKLGYPNHRECFATGYLS